MGPNLYLSTFWMFMLIIAHCTVKALYASLDKGSHRNKYRLKSIEMFWQMFDFQISSCNVDQSAIQDFWILLFSNKFMIEQNIFTKLLVDLK